MDIVNWDALKKKLLIRDTLENADDLVLVAANTTYSKRGDLYQTYAVPASALGGGGGGGGLSDQGIYNNAGTLELGAPTFAGASAIAFQTDRFIDLNAYSLSMFSSDSVLNITSTGLVTAVSINSGFVGVECNGTYGILANAGVNGGSFSGGVFGIEAVGEVAGVRGTGTSTGIIGSSETGIPFSGILNNTNASSTLTTLLLTRNCNPTVPVNGIGQAIEFQTSVTTPVGTGVEISNKLVSKFSNITLATRTSQFEIQGRNSGGPVEAQVTVKGTGLVQYNKYGSATFNGTVRYLLAVDTSGNVQEVTLAGLTNAANDAAAAALGVPLSGIYRNGSVLQIRAI